MRLDGRKRVTRLKRVKSDYCSTPKWLPDKWRQWYEDNNWLACKLHDNNLGENGIISKPVADKQFLNDSLKYGKISKPMAYISYWWVRLLHK